MGRFFVLPEKGIGPGGDIIFRKCHDEYQWYYVCLDDVKIGQVMLDVTNKWSGVSFAEKSEWFNIRSMEGFATRYDAGKFVIKHNGYWMHNERDMQKSIERAKAFIDRLNMQKSHDIVSNSEVL